MDPSVLNKEREKFRVLIAEDNQVNLMMLQVMLHEAGYSLYSVLNGKQALEYIHFGEVDLVLMDVHMPEMDGFTATQEIRKMQDPFNKIPVIAITAHALSGDKERCLEAGMNDYISKPVSAAELVSKLDKWLGITQKVMEPATARQYSSEVLDHEYLEGISLGNREFLNDLLLTYIEDIEVRLNNLAKALSTKDMKGIVLEAHSIKGASFSIGANIVGEAAREIELSGKANEDSTASSKMNLLTDAFKEAKKEILEFIE